MGFYEPQESIVITTILRQGMHFVDVGANWGYFTLLAADLVGPHGRVISFEPHPLLFNFLDNNVTINRLSWVTALQIAIGNTEGPMNLVGFQDNTENWGVSRLTEYPDSKEPNFSVQTGLCEILLKAHGIVEVDVLKMDIEGAEAIVLPTMTEGLSCARYRHILLELHPKAVAERGICPRSLVDILLRYGYRAWRIDPSRVAFRRAAYHLPRSLTTFLAPLDVGAPLDMRQHILFIAPNVKPSWLA